MSELARLNYALATNSCEQVSAYATHTRLALPPE
jgi:hypothetical protein